MRIELIYFGGCPNAGTARENLRAALADAGLPGEWREWKQEDAAAPPYAKQYGSPTVLVNGRDVTGGEAGAVAMACRADGAPTTEAIRRALAASR